MAVKYTDEQRSQAILLIQEGATITDAAAELNIPRSTVSSWWRARPSLVMTVVASDGGSERSSTSSDELQQLRVRLEKTELELEETKAKLQDLDKFLESKEAVFLWVLKKIHSEAKRNDESDSGWTPPGK